MDEYERDANAQKRMGPSLILQMQSQNIGIGERSTTRSFLYFSSLQDLVRLMTFRLGKELNFDADVLLATSHGRRSIDTLKLLAPEKANWDCR